MGTVFRKTVTRPLPARAEIVERKGERLARWRVRGKLRTALVTTGQDGALRVVEPSLFFVAKFRDGSGVVQTISTGCRDEQAARRVLADLERKAELVKAKVLTPAEAAVGEHQDRPLTEHLDAYTAFQRAKACHPNRINGDRSRVQRVAGALDWRRLADLNGEALTRWLGEQRDSGALTPANSN